MPELPEIAAHAERLDEAYAGTDLAAFRALTFTALKTYMKPKDIVDGLVKAEVFGFVIMIVCCYIGLNTRGGPREIGASVTKAVVTSLILILVLDYFVTKALLFT